eukprot:9319179-Ditylum_brightwellii.AAC.1
MGDFKLAGRYEGGSARTSRNSEKTGSRINTDEPIKTPQGKKHCYYVSGNITGFLNIVSCFISDTYQDLESSGFPAQITWQLVTKLVYQVFAGDLDEVRSFMRISHDTRDHLTLASCTMWAIFKTNKAMKTFQLQGLANHPSVVD